MKWAYFVIAKLVNLHKFDLQMVTFCPLSDQKFPYYFQAKKSAQFKKELIENADTITDEPKTLQCDKCDATYSEQSTLCKHKKSVSYKNGNIEQCSRCSMKFCSRLMLGRHGQEVHGDPAPAAPQNTEVRNI